MEFQLNAGKKMASSRKVFLATPAAGQKMNIRWQNWPALSPQEPLRRLLT
jgi:hypothetical protein